MHLFKRKGKSGIIFLKLHTAQYIELGDLVPLQMDGVDHQAAKLFCWSLTYNRQLDTERCYPTLPRYVFSWIGMKVRPFAGRWYRVRPRDVSGLLHLGFLRGGKSSDREISLMVLGYRRPSLLLQRGTRCNLRQNTDLEILWLKRLSHDTEKGSLSGWIEHNSDINLWQLFFGFAGKFARSHRVLTNTLTNSSEGIDYPLLIVHCRQWVANISSSFVRGYLTVMSSSWPRVLDISLLKTLSRGLHY
jgi:hypothetical protein